MPEEETTTAGVAEKGLIGRIIGTGYRNTQGQN